MLIVLSLRRKSKKILKYPHDGPTHFMHLVCTKKLPLPETNILPHWETILSFRVSVYFQNLFAVSFREGTVSESCPFKMETSSPIPCMYRIFTYLHLADFTGN